MFLFLHLLLLLLPFASECLLNPRQLGCERMNGEWGNYDTVFQKPMEIGDKYIVNGTVSPHPGIVRFNLASTMPGLVFVHFRCDICCERNVIWDTYFNGKWDRREYSPMPFRASQSYEVIMEYTGSTVEFTFNGAYLYSFRLRTGGQINQAQLYGTHTTNFQEMRCKNAPPTTRRPRPPPQNDDSHGHGHGHGHGHSGSSSDSESCER